VPCIGGDPTTIGGTSNGGSIRQVDPATGAILKTLPVGSSRVFSQPVFAQGTLFIATETKGLYNIAP
jgi:hypothetical protein